MKKIKGVERVILLVQEHMILSTKTVDKLLDRMHILVLFKHQHDRASTVSTSFSEAKGAWPCIAIVQVD